jgi:hypothetical protein
MDCKYYELPERSTRLVFLALDPNRAKPAQNYHSNGTKTYLMDQY